MADEAVENSQENFVFPQIDFPPVNFPVVFADGISSISPNREIVKFYLSRIDPNIKGTQETNVIPVIQVVMPVSGFIQMSIFIQKVMAAMLEQKLINQDQIDLAKTITGGPKLDVRQK